LCYFNGKRVAVRQSGTLYYLHTDHLGSTSVTSNASGAQVGSQTYYTYGAVRTTSGTLQTDYTFTGQRLDADAGLLYYGARYYDWVLGRFISADTIVPNPYNPQALNRYSYVYNNPLRYTDPTGHCPLCVAAIVYAKVVIINAAVDTAIDFGIAQFTGEPFNLGQSLATNLAIDAVTAGVGGKIAKSGKIAGLVAKYGDNATKIASHLGLSKFFGKEVAEEAVEKGLLSFTERSFRENLRRVTGKTAEEIADKQAHHVFPQEFVKKFEKLGLDVNDPTFGAWVDESHQAWSYDYAREWEKFFKRFEKEGIDPTLEEVLDFALGLAKEYKFDVLFTID
jgi:RHS repeat-associated protein